MVKEPRPHLVLKSLEVHEQLPLVVIGSAGVNSLLPGSRIVGNNRLERVCTPFFKRLRRLHVIVPVNQDGLGGADVLAAEDDGMACRFINIGLVRARLHQKFHKAFRAAAHIGLVLGLGADGRDPQQRKKLFEKTFLVLLDVLLHAVFGYS